MEPVTHVLTGACLARAGWNRRAAYATLAMATAAELPDIDTVWSLKGPVESFLHHRGITHTFLGIPFEAALVVALCAGLHRWRERKRTRERASLTEPLTAAPVRWGALYLFTVVALLSHILLDYTNNYGVRPFFPFNPKWYAGSIVFIFDPLLFLLLVGALVLPSLFALIGHEVAGKRDRFVGAGWARAALILIVGLWVFRAYEHSQALSVASLQTLRAPVTDPTQSAPAPSGVGASAPSTGQPTPEPPRPLLLPRRILASPDPLSPFRWYTATDFGSVYQLATVDTTSGGYSPERVLNQAGLSAPVLGAMASPLGRAYLDWSPMPWLSVSSTEAGVVDDEAAIPGARHALVVNFEDPRFMGSLSFLKSRPTPPLTGTVVVDPSGRVLGQAIDGKVER